MNKTVLKNFLYAFGAQIISLSASLAVTFFASAMIGVKEFGYWQLFLTYVSYVSMTRLGVNDGLYLRLGGQRYDELDFNLLSHERRYFNVMQLIISVVLLSFVVMSSVEPNRKFVLCTCAICIFIVTANGYLIYILQAVNRTSVYSVSVVLQNIPWFLAVFIIRVFRIYDYKIIIIMYVLGHILAGIYLIYHAREIVKHKSTKKVLVFHDLQENIKCGIMLMISTYAGSLIIASCRMVVDKFWGIEVFSVFSFALTLSNLFLTFISQTSIVVFPALRQVSRDKIQGVYYQLRSGLSLILPLVLFGYLPIVLIVHRFLPQYIPSLAFIPFFLPICTFDGKMQMMCSSFFKSMRKEKLLLVINLGTLACSIIMAIIGTTWIKNTTFVAMGILFVVAARSIVSELILARWMEVNIFKELTLELLIIIAFLLSSFYFSPSKMFLIYGVMYLIYLLINRKNVMVLVSLRSR